MNTANYLGQQTYPLSTDGLDFIQEQIKLVYNLTDLYGKYYIIRKSPNGLVVINGELMPLEGTLNKFITIKTSYSGSIQTHGQTFEKLRTIRKAEYTPSKEGENSYETSRFETMTSISDLKKELEAAKQHYTPKGTIIDWYCPSPHASLADLVPYGWVPCGCFCTTEDPSLNERGYECHKWRDKYKKFNIDIDETVYTGTSGGYSIRIKSVNGLVIPDLTDRFIVQAGRKYNCGDTGGLAEVTLTAEESGLPAHNHGLNAGRTKVHGYLHLTDHAGSGNNYEPLRGPETNEGNSYALNGAAANNDNLWVSGSTDENLGTTAKASHENRPPYFALYKLIKVI